MHPDRESFPHYIAFGYLTPNTTIATIIAIISHHKIVSRLDNKGEIPWSAQCIHLYRMIGVPQCLYRLLQAGLLPLGLRPASLCKFFIPVNLCRPASIAVGRSLAKS